MEAYLFKKMISPTASIVALLFELLQLALKLLRASNPISTSTPRYHRCNASLLCDVT